MAAEIAGASRKQRKSIVGLERTAADRLFAHPWPGNLRELSKVIQAAVALAAGEVIDDAALLLETAPSHPESGSVGASTDGEILTLAEVERRHVLEVLRRFGGNKRRAAHALDVSRATLDRKLARGAQPRIETMDETRRLVSALSPAALGNRVPNGTRARSGSSGESPEPASLLRVPSPSGSHAGKRVLVRGR